MLRVAKRVMERDVTKEMTLFPSNPRCAVQTSVLYTHIDVEVSHLNEFDCMSYHR